LPEPHRKKMLIKLCQADIEFNIQRNVESILAQDYPQTFLGMTLNGSYNWNSYTGEHLIEAYQTFAYEVLMENLVLSLKKESHNNVYFICQALTGKNSNEEIKVKDFQKILEKYNRPLERILLRPLRYHVNEHWYQR
jgi:hypothetical protein